MDTEKSIQKAKVKLMTMTNTVFYTSILFNLQQIVTTDIPTAATNGSKLLINPDFWTTLNKQEKLGLLLHEVMHVALDHFTRKGNRDPERWNIAGDVVINLFLVDAGYSLPAGAIIDKAFTGLTTEQVYNKLPDNTVKGIMGGDIQYPDPCDEAELKEAISTTILQAQDNAVSAGQAAGNLPSEVAVILQQRANPTLPWHTILSNYLNDMTKNDYTWAMPNKLFSPNFYLPSALSESLEHIAIAVDCSASVSDEEFATFMAEIDTIQKRLLPAEMTVLSFDTKIQQIHKVDNTVDVLYVLEFTGRGGTQVDCVMTWAKETKPKVLIIFTDGEFYIPNNPDIPIIWLIHNDSDWTCDYGTIIHHTIDC